MFTHGRTGEDLNGTWKFCPDPMQRCRTQQWWKNIADNTSFFPCWDPEGLWKIQVPGTWKTQVEELKWYDGHAVYMLDFELDDIPAGHETFLCFDGVVYEAEIYLNGSFVGRHEWGYSPFQYRVSGIVRPHEKNRLFVLVDNHLSPDRVPGMRFDWNNDGGIIYPVRLVHTPPVFVENFKVSTRLEPDAVRLDVDVWLQGRTEGAERQVRVSFPELGTEATMTVPANGQKRFSFELAPEHVNLWSPDNPYLYRIELATDAETLTDEVGLREVRTEGRQILLNGQPVRLYGCSIHSDFPDTGRTPTPAGLERLIAHLKDLGLNFVRCAHYPYAESVGRAFDRAGILWWEEVPAYWLLNMREEQQQKKALGMLDETMRRDWNRASLIIWSVSNECCWRNPENPADTNYSYWFKAASLIRSMDPSRLLSCAEAQNFVTARPVWNPAHADVFKSHKHDAPFWRAGHTDEWYRLFDILAANFYPFDEEEAEVVFKRFAEVLRPYNKPLMLSEFGYQSTRETAPGGQDSLGSEARHARILKRELEILAEIPEIVAYSPWCLADVRVPQHWRAYNNGKGVFRYGLMDETWEKKQAYDAFKLAVQELKKSLGEV